MYRVNGQTFKEDPAHKLGSGSEGAVYPHPESKDLCVKLFHTPEKGDASAIRIAQYRAKKIAAVTSLGLKLPPQFIIPLTATRGSDGEVNGFLMRKVKPGFVKIFQILKAQWRVANNFGLKEIALLFAELYGTDLKEIGANGLSVGDINTGCIMINPDRERSWVDMDSCSYPGFPCLATTELYAHPDLYPNITAGGTFVQPTIRHDRYAIAVMMVQMLLSGAHPFKMGTHPKYAGIRERAVAKVTIFDKGISYPPMLPPPEILSDELLHLIIQILKEKNDGSTLDAALKKFATVITSCPKCGADYSSTRAHCPKCHEKTIVDIHSLAQLLIETFHTTSSPMLRIQMIDDELRVVTSLRGNVNITIVSGNGTITKIPTSIPAVKGAHYSFFANCLVIAKDPYALPPVTLAIYRIEGKAVYEISGGSTTGGLENGRALTRTSSRFLYRTAGNTLMCAQLFGKSMISEEPVAQVHQSQTWFTVDRTSGTDREAIFGYDRALRDWQWFVIKGNTTGTQFQYHDVVVAPLRPAEKLIDFAVYFNKGHVLLVRKTSFNGQECVRYSIIRLDGNVEQDVLLESHDKNFEHWEHISGKLFQESSILHVTPNGVVKFEISSGQYTHLKDTEGVITIDDRLFKCGNKVGVAQQKAILTIAKKKTN